jgi:hypothetical protein
MCEEGAVKKMQVPVNFALQPPPQPSNMAPTCFSLELKKNRKETSLFLEAAEDGARHSVHVWPLLTLCVTVQSLPFPSTVSGSDCP